MSTDRTRMTDQDADDEFAPRRFVIRVDENERTTPAHQPVPVAMAEARPVTHTPSETRPTYVPPMPAVQARAGDRTSDEVMAVRHQIEQTRAEMSATIDALQERLRPQRLVDDAKEAARDALKGATVGKAEEFMDDMRYRARDTRAGITDTIRSNPLPAAIAAASLGWLFMNRSHTGTNRARYGSYSPYGGYRSDYDEEYGGRYGDYRTRERGGVGRVVEGARERVGDVAEGARETASRVADTAGGVVSSAGDVVSSAGERVQHMAYGAGHMATGAGSTMWDTISRNPVPAALVALGLGWLMKSSGGGQDTEDRGREYGYGYGTGTSYGYGRTYGTEYGTDYGSATSTTRPTAYESGYGVGERIGDVGERIGDMAGGAVDRVQHVGSAARHRVRRAGGTIEDFVIERPLAAGAVALGIGAALGLAMPGTAREDMLFGEARETLVERAQETAQEAAQRVARVAEQATQTAKDEARTEGLVQ